MQSSSLTKSLLCLSVSRHVPTTLFLFSIFVNLLNTSKLHLQKPSCIVRCTSMRIESRFHVYLANDQVLVKRRSIVFLNQFTYFTESR
ncbi:hypothetical protein WJ60_32050 [Burkholderia ubonensis]|nr:hypothetical protein WJ60_32050 [Burkholderia ubonensis]KVX83640.1 hypothetical protein WL08_08640 [Burkholderia ubonensis]